MKYTDNVVTVDEVTANKLLTYFHGLITRLDGIRLMPLFYAKDATFTSPFIRLNWNFGSPKESVQESLPNLNKKPSGTKK